LNSPLNYVGGKSKLADKIIDLIPEHKTYCEVFMGGGWVFFRKESSKFEVINDLDSDLVSFYRVLQNHLEEFLRQFKWALVSREQWFDYKDQLDGRGLTDIQRAARYYYVQRLCFGGRVYKRTFGTPVRSKPRINLLRMEEELSGVHLRLSQVMIENLTWQDCISKYDKDDTFFYLDPPYLTSPCYKYNFESIKDFEDLHDKIKSIKGKFLLSLNDHPDIRRIFKDFTIKALSISYSIHKGGRTEGKELIITNY